MKYEPYEFKSSDAYDFARHIGARTKEANGQLVFERCPYCNPKSLKGNSYKFAISLSTGQFMCLRASCGASGNMVTLSRDFDFSLGNEVDEYYKPRRKYKKPYTLSKPIEPKDKVIEYFSRRGISAETVERYQIATGKKPNIAAFLFMDEKGSVRFVKYRNMDYKPGSEGSKEWSEKGMQAILFGMYQCDPEIKSLVITEGQIDSMSVAECGIKNAVSVPTGALGFTWVPACWEWLHRFDEIIVFGDFEHGEMTLLDGIRRRFKKRVRRVREEDYRGCKDANEILQKYGKDQVRACVENAVAMVPRNVINLADVENVDVFKIPKVKTGLRELDRLLCGGLPLGGVVLITGKTGCGKSTLASQISINAIHQGYKCFAYSGELPNYLFKAWIDYQVAGRRHVIEYQDRWGDTSYNISKANKDLISAWYAEKYFLYDNRIIDDDERESLVKICERVILQYGIKVILLDNLMTAIDLESSRGDDKYERQSNFIKRLVRLAQEMDVLIMLVAHKRKNNFSRDENDEISGSADIANLATVTVSYDRDGNLKDSQRMMRVSKNRLFGRTNNDGFVLDFDERSKRIHGILDDVDYDYGWSVNEFEEYDGETPFDSPLESEGQK